MDYTDVAPAAECVDGPEKDMLAFALDRVRAQFAWKTGGLTAEQLRRTHPPSTLTIAGLIKHMAFVEERYTRIHLQGRAPGRPWSEVDWNADLEWDWHSAVHDEPDELYALWYSSVARARAIWAETDLDAPSTLMAEGTPASARRLQIDVLEEYLRHTGHADLLREAIDGLVGNDPPRRD
ncbi:DinB family protein [Pseudonocardia sp. CA-107938]|uniref:DinB family protein n=1 Tax=Pseudonocardia sp. CA-107938 TaxID=3240021 RepID=UPI003D8B5421